MGIHIEVPDELAKAMRLPKREIPARLIKELAIVLYAKELLTFGKARQLAGLTRWEFHDLLGEESVLRRYDVEELEEDIKTLENLG